MALLHLALLLTALAPGTAPAKLALGPCWLGAGEVATPVAARCGVLTVPEDPDRPGGRQLGLRVALVAADSTHPAPDPLFLLAGGPGQAATEAFPAARAAFSGVGRTRDLVLVDQRGTGGSGGLRCPELDDDAVDRGEAEELRRVEACARALAGSADLHHYGTLDFARDLDAVRAALGYERINLLGASYGTRAALVYARAYPGRVRSLILDGVAPLEMAIGGSFAEDGQRALELAFGRCRADAACAARFPDPAGDLLALAAELDARPRRLALRDPQSGAPLALELRGDRIRQIAQGLAYSPETVALLPALLREARGGDPGPLALQGVIAGRRAGGPIHRALQLAVLCAEDAPFLAPAPPGPLWLGQTMRRALLAGCARWPHRPVDPSFRAPVRSTAPALLLSGEGDPVTPPRWAEAALRGLPAGRHLVVPGAGHGTLLEGCVPRLLAAFLEAGSAAGLDASCLERLRPPPFFLDLSGPPP